MVGDVKSGEAIDVKHLLICAGYALAYENWKGEDINWGMIYLIKTKNSQRIGKYVSLPQIYIFPIDDDLRGFFIQRRNEALQIVSRPRLPKKPSSMKDRRLYCRDCVYRKVCEEDGLEVPE
jgi:CRISPR/Cas system-associated exonuclease Cas4 (RecB family)